MTGFRLFVLLLLVVVVGGCATTQSQPGQSGRKGMDRVSPVQAADVNTRLGVGYFERGDLEVAIDKLERAIELDPAHVPAYVTLALIQERLGRESRARRYFSEAVRLAPEDGATLNSYATFLCREGEYEEADELFRRAIDDPFYDTREVAYSNAGSCAIRSNRYDEAEDYLREALDINSEHPNALYHLARLFLQRDEAFKARAFMQRYEAAAGVDPEALLLGYRIEQRLGNEREAARYFRRLEEEFPESAEARDIRQQTSQDD
ncbi:MULTISPECIES: type IV pilus biogenesis/stability protein PilW [unclassified Wenzhouxiangella]|uniref:type IV pilus biogenesis/stability protein PilW n=1 Tax=unclassified Wenzhouxiangella TaxID=2613841 RepID=UPI000E32A029|nr:MULTISPECIES: type IV pilus biogenesis/stability protein PilW [unclassified Wenzhouxiangella]RFF27970.1 type IV pilus biogenesis/stability protein PilW [Wenzhouxiangella sp. 15181]RFP68557.1 type IV pilus biogenesis/stability protein PilW [Wenzhouxiangella sp. 15190]